MRLRGIWTLFMVMLTAGIGPGGTLDPKQQGDRLFCAAVDRAMCKGFISREGKTTIEPDGSKESIGAVTCTPLVVVSPTDELAVELRAEALRPAAVAYVEATIARLQEQKAPLPLSREAKEFINLYVACLNKYSSQQPVPER